MKASLCFLLWMPAAAGAQQTDRVTVSGIIDVYYSYDFTRPANRIRPFATEPARTHHLVACSHTLT